jgi:uncharacterized protein (DUF433 family)
MTQFTRITGNPAAMQGKACIRGMRVGEVPIQAFHGSPEQVRR